jgi:hypothetical protein
MFARRRLEFRRARETIIRQGQKKRGNRNKACGKPRITLDGQRRDAVLPHGVAARGEHDSRGNSMRGQLNLPVGRRSILRALAVGAGAAAAGVPTTAMAAATAVTTDANGRARYQPDSAQVQTFYRVNRYPKKT